MTSHLRSAKFADVICLVGRPLIGTITQKTLPMFLAASSVAVELAASQSARRLARQLPHGVISVTFPHGSLLNPVWGDAADVGNSKGLELAAEIERLVVAALVDHGAIKLFAPAKVEGIDDVRGEVNVSPGSVEGVCKLSARKQRAFDDKDNFPAEITVRVSGRGKVWGWVPWRPCQWSNSFPMPLGSLSAGRSRRTRRRRPSEIRAIGPGVMMR